VPRSLAGLLLVSTLAARAAEPPPTSTPDAALRPAFLQLYVNGIPGETALVLVGERDVLASPADLNRAGLSGFGGVREEVDGRAVVSLRSLAPALRFTVDEGALALRVEAGPDLLGRGALDFRPSSRPPGLELESTPGAFLNWAVRGDTDEQVSGALEAAASAGPALLTGSVTADREGGPVRGLTALTVDDTRRLLRFTAGDAYVPGDALGGAPIVGGVTLARELSLDPYLVRAPLPKARAFAATPSTVEVYVNGALARTEAVSPGTYDLSNLPVSTGANDVRVVVKDAFGRIETVDASHYQTQGLLARGLLEGGLSLGAVRRRFGVESFDYGDPIALARARYGLTDRLTAGARTELGPTVQQGSLALGLALPVGELETSAAASADEGEAGAAAFLAWRAVSRRLSVGADATILSTRYATSTLRAADDRPLWRAGAFAAVPLARVATVQLQWTGSERRDAGASHRLEARTTLPLGARTFLLLAGSVDLAGSARPDGAVFAQLVIAGNAGETWDVGLRGADGTGTGTLGAQRGLPRGVGTGWRVRADSAAQGTLSALVQLQAEQGRLEAGYDQLGPREVGSLAAMGGLVVAGGRAFVTRPVEQSWALVRVPGVEGVRATLDRQPAGRTDARGDLLVPGLLPYYGTRLGIEDADVPPTYRVGRTERLVAAPPRGGALVRFDVRRLRALEGTVRLAGPAGPVVPAFGTLEVDAPGGPFRSPLGGDGAFWLEDVPAGTHAARVYFEGKLCEFPLVVPPAGDGVVLTGELGCPPAPAP
jgi:outer membrane usher protein